MRRWWRDEGARELGADPALPTEPPENPIRITCALGGEIVHVTFAEGAKAHMTDAALLDALRRAAKQAAFAPPAMPDAATRDERLDAYRRQAAEITAWLGHLVASSVDPNAKVRSGMSDDRAVRVTYRGSRLADIAVTPPSWVLLHSEAQIEAALIQASRYALGLAQRNLTIPQPPVPPGGRTGGPAWL